MLPIVGQSSLCSFQRLRLGHWMLMEQQAKEKLSCKTGLQKRLSKGDIDTKTVFYSWLQNALFSESFFASGYDKSS